MKCIACAGKHYKFFYFGDVRWSLCKACAKEGRRFLRRADSGWDYGRVDD